MTSIDAPLTNGIRYYYVISATTPLGESMNSAQASALPVPPPAPSTPPANLTATPGTNTVSLGWSAVSDATAYNVKRSLVSGGPYAVIATSGGTSYVDTGATGGTTYYYVVSATNHGGESANSSQAAATPLTSIAAWRSNCFSAAEITAGLAADNADPDGDGFSNLTEYVLGTDPHAATPQPLVLTPAPGNHFNLTFTARSATGTGYAGLARKYDVETTTDPANPASWQGIAGYLNISGADQTVTINLPFGTPHNFYRLNVRVE